MLLEVVVIVVTVVEVVYFIEMMKLMTMMSFVSHPTSCAIRQFTTNNASTLSRQSDKIMASVSSSKYLHPQSLMSTVTAGTTFQSRGIDLTKNRSNSIAESIVESSTLDDSNSNNSNQEFDNQRQITNHVHHSFLQSINMRNPNTRNMVVPKNHSPYNSDQSDVPGNSKLISRDSTSSVSDQEPQLYDSGKPPRPKNDSNSNLLSFRQKINNNPRLTTRTSYNL